MPPTVQAEDFWALLQRVWNHPLIAGDPPILVSNVVLGLLYFVLAIVLSKVISRVLIRRLLQKRVEEGVLAAYQGLAFYFVLVLLLILAMKFAGIPVTMFTILGGALAIGVGFGSQSIINNFLSGFVILMERPIRTGDLIEVEGIFGTVEKIGIRSTRVRTGSNYHVILPNSSFLQERVVNWTLSDRKIRIMVSVGVVYGSPVDEVTRLLPQALPKNEKVMSDPAPVVLFRDFGDNALIFEIHFWVEMRNLMDRWKIESSVRYNAEELFRKAGIVVAFPQRDVHLYPAGPVDVRLVSATPDGKPA